MCIPFLLFLFFVFLRVETPVLRGHAVPPRVLEPAAGAVAAVPRAAPRQQRPDRRVARGQRELRPQARWAGRWAGRWAD